MHLDCASSFFQITLVTCVSQWPEFVASNSLLEVTASGISEIQEQNGRVLREKLPQLGSL